MSKWSHAQLEQYYDYIGLSSDDRPSNLSVLDDESQLQLLQKVLQHQLCRVPFENLDLHYAPVRGVSLNSDFLFHKVVTRKCGRGGYCMQNNSLFACALRAIGYHVRSVGARVSRDFKSSSPPYSGWSHQVNLITIGHIKYMVDVGFGNEGPTRPMPLYDDRKILMTGDESRVGYYGQICVVRDEEFDTKSFIYQISRDLISPCTPRYCFTDIEFLPSDFDVVSFHVANSRNTMFVNNVICSKFLMSADRSCIEGDLTLFNSDIKERRFGTSRPLAEIKSESDRVLALERYMGIQLLPEEAAGIKGLNTEIV